MRLREIVGTARRQSTYNSPPVQTHLHDSGNVVIQATIRNIRIKIIYNKDVCLPVLASVHGICALSKLIVCREKEVDLSLPRSTSPSQLIHVVKVMRMRKVVSSFSKTSKRGGGKVCGSLYIYTFTEFLTILSAIHITNVSFIFFSNGGQRTSRKEEEEEPLSSK